MTKEARRIYGFLLSATHLVTLIFWSVPNFDFGLLDKLRMPGWNRWPFIPEFLPGFVESHALLFVASYSLLAFVSPLLFLIPRVPFKVAMAVFAAAFLVKLSIFFSSYDFMGNYHYMANLVMLAFLLTGGRLFFIQVLIACFYFGAGLIKLNWEWMSGSALLVDTFISGPLLIAACVYVIVLELFLIWGLFAKSRKVRLFVFAQLIAFHAFSWHIVGFYYPVVMLLMITVFLLEDPWKEFSVFPRGKGHVFLLAGVAVFLAAQLYPKLLNKNDSVTAEGRMLSLNMLDAKTECLPSFEIRTEEGFLQLDDPLTYAVRIRCDPLVYFNYGKRLCEESASGRPPSVILNLKTKKKSDEDYRWVVRDLDVCDKDLRYSIWGNAWVRDETRKAPAPSEDSVPDQSPVVWRQDPARTGRSSQSVPLNGHVRILPQPLQSGIHLAAKSSPVGGRHWVVGSDSGRLFGFEGERLLWTDVFPRPEYGFHGAAVWTAKDRFVIGSYDGVLHSIDGATGKRLWAEALGGAIGASPLHLGSLIFVPVELPQVDGSRFVAVDAGSGDPVWKSAVYPGLAHASFAYDAASDLLLGATNHGLIIALQRKDGREAWRKEIPGKLISSPLVAEGAVYNLSTEGWLAKHRTKDGKEIWRRRLEHGSRASPAFSERTGLLIVPLENGALLGLRASDGTEIWRRHEAHLHVSSGLLSENPGTSIYWDQCAEKSLCALRVEDGKVLRKIPLPENFSSTPMILDGVLTVTLDGEGGILRLSPTAEN